VGKREERPEAPGGRRSSEDGCHIALDLSPTQLKGKNTKGTIKKN